MIFNFLKNLLFLMEKTLINTREENNDNSNNNNLNPLQINPFCDHFHHQINIMNQHVHPLNLKEPNQIPFPNELNPRHKHIGEDVDEFKHFRNIVAAFINYKVK